MNQVQYYFFLLVYSISVLSDYFYLLIIHFTLSLGKVKDIYTTIICKIISDSWLEKKINLKIAISGFADNNNNKKN